MPKQQQAEANYRISLKALIRDEQGRVLLVKEAGDTWWGLPGGGFDHNESMHSCLSRELAEELGVKLGWVGVAPTFVWKFYATYADGTPDRWVVWVVYEAGLAHTPPAGHLGQSIKFYTPDEIIPSVLAHYHTRAAFDQFQEYIRGY